MNSITKQLHFGFFGILSCGLSLVVAKSIEGHRSQWKHEQQTWCCICMTQSPDKAVSQST